MAGIVAGVVDAALLADTACQAAYGFADLGA